MEIEFPLSLNLESLSKDKNQLPFIRIFALDLIDNPYKTIGSFFTSLSNYDLATILNLIEVEEDTAIKTVILLAEMLAQSEGLASQNLDQLTYRTNTLSTYIVLESLYRKGLIKLYHENMSFGEEYDDRIIAEKINFDDIA